MNRLRILKSLGLLAAALLLTAGCGNSETAAATSAKLPASADPKLQEAETALQARDYDKAAEILIAFQQDRQQSPEQKGIAANLMGRLQPEVAKALASGDPKAKAAADRLRNAAPR